MYIKYKNRNLIKNKKFKKFKMLVYNELKSVVVF